MRSNRTGAPGRRQNAFVKCDGTIQCTCMCKRPWAVAAMCVASMKALEDLCCKVVLDLFLALFAGARLQQPP